MSDLGEMDYDMTEDSCSEEDCDERLEEIYFYAKAEPSSEAQLRRFRDLLSLEAVMQRKTVWGFKTAKRLLKTAIEQADSDAIIARYGQLLSYANAVTTNDFERPVSKIVNLLASLSRTEILRALFFISITNAP
ncbi:hypothetical protein AAVH_26110, partial [Aphelenchoides avenae]